MTLLGRVTVAYGDRELESFLTSRVRDLLVSLILRRGEPVDRLHLIERLWPTSRSENDRNKLSVTLYHLKKALKSIGAPVDEVLFADRSNISIDPTRFEVDLWEIEEACRAGRTGQGDGKREACRRVFDLYKGWLNPSCHLSWIQPWRTEIAALFDETVEWLWRDAVASGDRDLARSYLRDALARSPQSVSAMEALARFYDEDGNGEMTLDLCRSILQVYRDKRTQPSPRISEFTRAMKSKYGSGGERSPREAPTLTACVVDEAGYETLQRVSTSFGVEHSSSPDYVLVPNPMAARDLAEELLKRNQEVRVILHTVVQYPDEPLPTSVRRLHRVIPEGELWASRGAAAILADHGVSQVRERTGLRSAYRLE